MVEYINPDLWFPKYQGSNLLITYWRSFLCDKSLLSCCFQDFLLLSTVFVSPHDFLWIILIRHSLRFLGVYVQVFPQIWEVFRHYLFPFAPVYLSSGTPIMHVWSSGRRFTDWNLSFFHLPSLFILCSPDLTISIVLSSNSLILLLLKSVLIAI